MELGGRNINKKNFEIPNKHSFNKPSTKKNTQNYCFLGYYNAIIHENETYPFFKSSTSTMHTSTQQLTNKLPKKKSL